MLALSKTQLHNSLWADTWNSIITLKCPQHEPSVASQLMNMFLLRVLFPTQYSPRDNACYR